MVSLKRAMNLVFGRVELDTRIGEERYPLIDLERHAKPTENLAPVLIRTDDGSYLQVYSPSAGYPDKILGDMLAQAQATKLAQIADISNRVVVVGVSTTPDQAMGSYLRKMTTAREAIAFYMEQTVKAPERDTLAAQAAKPQGGPGGAGTP